MNVYLAGPITGIPNKNRKAFNRYADLLRSRGHDVFNPTTLPDDMTANQCMAYELQYICLHGVEAIAFMPGWENSKGSRVEHALAVALDLKRIYLEDVSEEIAITDPAHGTDINIRQLRTGS